jgi:hypothetical protein
MMIQKKDVLADLPIDTGETPERTYDGEEVEVAKSLVKRSEVPGV